MEGNLRSSSVPSVVIRPSTVEDAQYVAAHMRPADVEELAAAGRDPLDALLDGIIASDFVRTVVVDGKPAAVYGVAAYGIPGVGCPWMLTTADILKISMTFRRHCRTVVQHMNQLYPLLINYVDDRNGVAKAWLHWCGFRFTRKVAAPADPRHTFIEFVRHPNV
jgi:hypothetical protein